MPTNPSLGHSKIHRKSFQNNRLCDITRILNATLGSSLALVSLDNTWESYTVLQIDGGAMKTKTAGMRIIVWAHIAMRNV